MSERTQAQTIQNRRPKKRVLFLAQTPPPHHGQSAIAALVREVFETDAEMIIDQKWRGGAQSNKDVGKKSVGKYLGFVGFLLELLFLALIGRRYDFAYMGIAPWAHTALRDALLAGFAKMLSRRTWIHVHGNGLTDLIAKPGFTGAIIRRLLSGTEVVAITEEACQSARASGLFARVLPLANMSMDPGEPDAAGNGTVTIACLGNLDPRKGVLDFVDAVSLVGQKHAQVRGVIIGGATAQLDVEDVRERAAGYGADTRIDVTGWVSEERKSALLAEADIFLYLSRHDLAPVALIEALAHGCAPIVLDIGGLAEMVGRDLNGNVITETEPRASLGHACAMMEAYLADPRALARDKHLARQRYLDAYSPKIFRANILRFLARPDDAESGRGDRTNPMIANQTS